MTPVSIIMVDIIRRTTTNREEADLETSVANRRGRPTAEQRVGRRERMLQRSLPVFLEHGYQGATLAELARASGVTKRTIYTDYGGKEGLFAAMVDALAGGISQTADTVGETLLSLATRIVFRIHSDDLVALHRLVIAEAQRLPELATAFYEHTDARHIAALRAHIVGDHNADAAGLAAALFSLLLGERHRQRLLGVRGPATDAEAARIARQALRRLGLDVR
jgi:AcrR family transcriptional regulator